MVKGAIEFTKRKGAVLVRFSIPGMLAFLVFLSTIDVWAPYAECPEAETEGFDKRINCVLDWYRELEKANFDPDYKVDGNAPGHPDDH